MSANAPDEPLDELLSLACSIARDAGDLVAAGRVNGIGGIATKTSATDIVTEFDRASERLIVERLRAARPSDALVGEEGTASGGTSGIGWLIDPIDGTVNFLYGLPGYAVSIAAADRSSALVGAVYVPATNELFAAARGRGATLNGRPIACSTTADLAQALVGTGFSYRPERRARQAVRVAGLIDRVRDIRRFGAAAVDLCHVAAGRLDAYYEEWLGPWDLAAGALIAREAGCRLGDFTGGPVRPDEVLVSNEALFGPLSALIAEIDARTATTGGAA